MIMYCQKCRQPVANEDDSHTQCPFCDSPLVPRKIFAPGETIAGFTIVRELGHGGMGVVYLAEQTNLDRYVALKVLEETLAGDQEFVKSFFREAGAAAKMAHPNIVQAYDAGIENGVCYFVMELIQGENLDDYVTKNGPMQVGLLLNVAIYISDALSYAWERNHLCHGDIKPENIIIQENGEIKLADLGLARDHTFDTLTPGEIMATPAYAPPEVIRGEINRINFKADMYSFGTTLYHLATGAPPFPEEDPKIVCAQQLNNQPKPLIAIDPYIPEELSVLVDQLMEKSPDHRPYSWAVVTQKLMMIRRTYNQARADKQNHDKKLETQINSNRGQLNKYTWTMIVLIALVCFLSAALLTVHFVSGHAENDPAQTSDSSNTMKQPVWIQWNKLKSEIRSLSNAQALHRIQQFVQLYKDAPHEAHVIRESYSKLARFDQRKIPFLENKKIILNACRQNRGTAQKDHPAVAKQYLFETHAFLQQYHLLLRYAKLIKLDLHDKDALLSNAEKLAVEQYCGKLSQNISNYPAYKNNFSQAQQRRFAGQEAGLHLRMPAHINSYADMIRFIESCQDFKLHRIKFLPGHLKNDFNKLGIITNSDFFVSDSQYLINMKEYLRGRKISNNDKIMDVTDNGILCFSGKTEKSYVIQWNNIYDLWLDPSCELLEPALPFMNEKDAIQFYARSLIRKKHPEYYQTLLKKARKISNANRAGLNRITVLFLKK